MIWDCRKFQFEVRERTEDEIKEFVIVHYGSYIWNVYKYVGNQRVNGERCIVADFVERDTGIGKITIVIADYYDFIGEIHRI